MRKRKEKKLTLKTSGLEPIVLSEKKQKRMPWLRSYYRPFFFVAVPLSLLSSFFAIFFWRYLPPFIPLFYTRLQVEEQLAEKNWIFVLAGIALSIDVIHFLVIYLARKRDPTLLRVFSYATIFLQLLLLTIVLRTILIII